MRTDTALVIAEHLAIVTKTEHDNGISDKLLNHGLFAGNHALVKH